MTQPDPEPKGFNRLTSNEQLRDFKAKTYAEAVQPYAAAICMVREAIGELFGPIAALESEEAVLLRGPEPHHDAEAIIAALQRVKIRYDAIRRELNNDSGMGF